MNTRITALAAVATLAISSLGLGGVALAQASNGPDAKGNAPLKAPHTVNDGTPKRGATSFTENQARKHILNAGYTAVSGLAKGDDGVWRGVATRDGASRNVALDFKGNVSDAGAAAASTTATTVHKAPVHATETTKTKTTTTTTAPMAAADTTTSTDVTATPTHAHHHHRHHHRHHRGTVACANPAPNGAACSGVDRNKNGISDKEDRAINAGAHP